MKNLRSVAIVNYMLDKASLGQERLANELFPDQSNPRKKIMRWLKGHDIADNNRSVLLDRFPELEWFFDTPVFEWINPEITLSHDEVLEKLKAFQNQNDKALGYWNLSKYDDFGQHFKTPIICRENTPALAEYGGIDGFVVILGLLRSQKWNHIFLKQHIVQALRAFPHLARHPAFKPNWLSYYAMLKRLRYKLLRVIDDVIPDDYMMKSYVEMDEPYKLWRGANGRVSKSGKFVTTPAPVLMIKEFEHWRP
ncbi:MAG: hypothetical protein MK096_13860 [Oleiphilaceae bacterium]|nr:hypothetical protein [Oleiphilaceae bacterium]